MTTRDENIRGFTRKKSEANGVVIQAAVSCSSLILKPSCDFWVALAVGTYAFVPAFHPLAAVAVVVLV